MRAEDRYKLETIEREWQAECADSGAVVDSVHAFAYWLIRYSEWSVEQKGEDNGGDKQ